MSAKKDDRYDRVFTDPTFWSVPRSQKRLKIDKRFERMFSEDRFCARSAPVDRRGRPSELVRWTDKAKVAGGRYKSDLEKFYEVSKDPSTESDIPKEESNAIHNKGEKVEREKMATTKKLADKKEKHKKDSVATIEKRQKEKWKNTEETDVSIETTSRLAVCNQDWDRIRAIDLFMLFRSFLPPETSESTDVVRRVTIYQSMYGAERQAVDDAKGPTELRKAVKQSGEEDEDALREGLVEYQRNRLRYCYAVVECDSPATALSFYQQLDGMEYEDSCTRLDLRFIPDDTSFDDCNVMSVADSQQTMNNSFAYEPPPSFVTTALGQTAVKLTWEEEQTPQRKRALQALLEVDSDNDDQGNVDNLLAPPSDIEEENNEDRKNDESLSDSGSDSNDESKFQRYRSLLLEAASPEEETPGAEDAPHMEVTWDPGLAGDEANEISRNGDDSSLESDSNLGSVKKSRSQKEKKKKRSNNAKQSTENVDDVQAFSMMFRSGEDETKSFNPKGAVDGANDPRFAALLTRPEFHRDVDHAGPRKLKRKNNANKGDRKNKHKQTVHFH